MARSEADGGLPPTNLKEQRPEIISLNQSIQVVSDLITSPNTPQVNVGLKYLPNILQRLEPFSKTSGLHQTYSLFKPIILAAPNLNPDQKSLYVEAVSSNDLAFYSAFSEQISTDPYFKTEELLQCHSFKLLGLNPEETKEIILGNWVNVADYLKDLKQSDSELTLDILREVSGRSSAIILPSFAQGFRHDPIPSSLNHLTPSLREIHYRNKILSARGASADKLENMMQNLVNRANYLIKNETNKPRFEDSIALLAADYAFIHPYPDGNGTKTIFFIETCMALRGDYQLLSNYEIDIGKRAHQVLRNNSKATRILKGKITLNMLKAKFSNLKKTPDTTS